VSCSRNLCAWVSGRIWHSRLLTKQTNVI
jgi:hypothetical protein